ncbi:2-methylcitrate dehydratase [Alicycliphilus denitrificans]|uniref:2-methylcitrate dehydratase n=1 Tax=Alicycliphilus denitrificans TaxID=179636 RepID=A0A858ZWL7_9BURK|nr:MmgE/PrpD family protein [Alicycliphilus denitrificans BC]QKD45386.1 2-methylcitrate dehydratase [Alicycliphilus denitrificans]GAO24869.1 mmge/prpd family protein [Alicycliphilus sp. B1]
MDSKVNTDFWSLAETIYARRAPAIEVAAMEHARRAWLDTLACMVGGAGEPAARAAAQAADTAGAEHRALVLGAASHALDYDDVCMLATCHPSAPVVSALLAGIDRAEGEVTLADLLAAHLVGTETMLRLGAWLGFGHYALGFHATGTLGVVGAAAAYAYLLRLPVAQWRTALSIAASSACGLRANFGTDTKPLHVGFAASAAIRAVGLARAGATASDDALAGFAQAFAGGARLDPPRWDALTPWAVLAPGFEVKRYPSCYLTHRMIAGIQRLRERHPPQAGDAPVAIDLLLPHGSVAPLKYPQPRTGLQAKFSAPYCAAAAWVDGHVGLASFSDAAANRGALLPQMRQVRVAERPGPHEPLETAPVRVTITGPGWIDAILVDWAPGSLQDPVTDEDLLAKWVDCAANGQVAAPAAIATGWLAAGMDQPMGSLLHSLRRAILARSGNAGG